MFRRSSSPCLVAWLLSAILLLPGIARADDIEVAFSPPGSEQDASADVLRVRSNTVNDIRIWVWDQHTNTPLPYRKVRIWADRGLFVKGRGQAAEVWTGTRGIATAGWTITQGEVDALAAEERRATFHVRLPEDKPGVPRDTWTASIAPPVIEEQQDVNEESYDSATHGELCNMGLDLSFTDLICDWGGDEREYHVNSSASPSLAYMQVGDVHDFTYKLSIQNHQCSDCTGCSWTSTENFCGACFATQTNCNGWADYESLRYSGFLMVYIMVPKNDAGEPVMAPALYTDLHLQPRLKVDPVAMPVPLVGDLVTIIDILQPGAATATLAVLTSFQDSFDPRQYDLPMVNISDPSTPEEITMFTLWNLYAIQSLLEFFGVELNLGLVTGSKNMWGLKDLTKLEYGTKFAKKVSIILEVVQKAIEVTGSMLNYLTQLGLVSLTIGDPQAGGQPAGFPPGYGNPLLDIPEETDDYKIYPVPVLLWPMPYDGVEIRIPMQALASTEDMLGQIVPVPAYIFSVQERKLNLLLTEQSLLASSGNAHSQRAMIMDALPRCELGETRCASETVLEQCAWGTYFDYGDDDYKWYLWEPINAPPDHLCEDGELVPECNEGDTRCTRAGDDWDSYFSTCEFSATDEYEIEHWHWIDHPVPVNQACKDGELIPLELPDCPDSIVLYSDVTPGTGKVLDWCPLHKAHTFSCDDRGNLYACYSDGLHCRSSYAYGRFVGYPPEPPAECEGNALELQCDPPCGEGETCKADAGGASHCAPYCRPSCIVPHPAWPEDPEWGGDRRKGRWKVCGDDGCGGSCGSGCPGGIPCIDGACASCNQNGDLQCGNPSVGSGANPDLGACSCADNCGWGDTPCCPDLCDYCPNTWIRFNPAYGLQDFNMCFCEPDAICQQADAFGLKCGAASDGCGGRCQCPEGTYCGWSQAASDAHRDPWRCHCRSDWRNVDFYHRDELPYYWGHWFGYRECDHGCGDVEPCPGAGEPCLTIEREWSGETLTGIGICGGTVNCEDLTLPYGRKQCGSNGYGGVCGQFGGGCQDFHECSPEGRCVCAPTCVGPTGNPYECGSDHCGGSCGDCPPQHACRWIYWKQAYECECVPDCTGRECGDDGCGGSCGECAPAYANTECVDGLCQCEPGCDGKDCGDDRCGGTCGECAYGQACSADQSCEPFNSGCRAYPWPGCDGCGCEAEVCGIDPTCCSEAWDEYCVSLCRTSTAGCGTDYCDNGIGICDSTAGEDCGSCPADCPCPDGQTCTSDGRCCTPDCEGKQCGPDGCGGSCGSCAGGVCDHGMCAASDSCAGYCPSDRWDVFQRGPGDACGCGAACATLDDCCSGACECGASARVDLRLEETTLTDGARAADSSRDEVAVTLAAGDAGERSIADGRFGRAVHLEAGDALEIGGTLLDDPDPVTPFSASLWLRTTASGGRLIEQELDAGSATRFQLRLLSDGRLSYEKGGVAVASTSAAVNDGQWHQVGFVRDDLGRVDLFVDGGRNGTSGTDASEYDAASTVVGPEYSGDLDDIVVFSGVLSDGDMSQIAGERAHLYYGFVRFCDPECAPDCSDYGHQMGLGYTTGPDGCGGWCPCPGSATPMQVSAQEWVCAVDSCTDACDLLGVVRRDTGCGCTTDCIEGGEQTSNCCPELCTECPENPLCPIVASCDGLECGTVLEQYMPPQYCGEDGGGCIDPARVCLPDGSCCLPDCTGKDCDDDGCGDSCGECTGAQETCQDGLCTCAPDCDGKVCGDDGCGSSCGDCTGAQEVCQDGACVCVPDCDGRVCGDDGCDGMCGACSPGFACDITGTCVCVPDCGGKACGDDGCGGSCGDCTGAQQICLDGECACVPDCDGRACGDDGCGGSCGDCPGSQDDCQDGTCVCVPSCVEGVECGGDNGCGGTCGDCPEGQTCLTALQRCLPEAVSDGDTISIQPGCNGCACEACVCGVDPECCSEAWLERCVYLCDGVCGGTVNGDCGNGFCETNADEDCESCVADCGCAAGETCYQGTCTVCSCEGRECGDNGCGASCGSCSGSQEPCISGTCECVPDCDGKECGDDGCEGSCGECAEDMGLFCHEGACLPPTCEGRCGGASAGDCFCEPGCLDNRDCCPDFCVHCGADVAACPDGCGDATCDAAAGENCINCFVDCPCEVGQACDPDGVCCAPACEDKACGMDGCGGLCGKCEGSLASCVDGTCVCEADCEGKVCGDDGCGGSCGDCDGGLVCVSGICAATDSCAGSCGRQAPDGCMCDEGCEGRGDCCSDRCDACPTLLSCSGCGDGQCDAEAGESCLSCPDDCACDAGQVCFGDSCCTPDCASRNCGGDGCGGDCGECQDPAVCTLEGRCSTGPGCQSSDEPGCTGCRCTECVCQHRPNCCTERWDATCASLCGEWCGGCEALAHCGDGTCQADEGEYCGSCPTDCACEQGQQCRPASGCCAPDCEGKDCGSDGCGGTCGECTDGVCIAGLCRSGAGCSASGSAGCGGCACENCVCQQLPECCTSSWGEGCVALCNLSCGGCGAQDDCGNGTCEPEKRETCYGCPQDCTCEQGDVCTQEGACCTPDCDGKDCGDDGCGGSCGTCTDGTCLEVDCHAGAGCVASGETPGCGGCACEPCVTALKPSCGDTAWDETCVTLCETRCGGCGVLESCDDGTCAPQAGETCANCPADCECDPVQTCASFGCCTPYGADLECGDDGCGGWNGECVDPGFCFVGQCLQGPGCDVSAGPEPSGLGCGGCACEGCVCDLAPECCTLSWTDRCRFLCLALCGGCGMLQTCGNGVCDDDGVENCTNCPADCACAAGEVCTSGACVTDWCAHGVTEQGCCVGSRLYSCLDGRLTSVDCAWSGEHCGWRAAAGGETVEGFYDCGTPPVLLTAGDPSDSRPLSCEEYCVPDCADKQCGDDGCGGSCGDCDAGYACDEAGHCVCAPNCTGRQCGDDGCGGSCGDCPAIDACHEPGTCMESACIAGAEIPCETDRACFLASCDPSRGCLEQQQADGTRCTTDGDESGRCVSGACTALAPGDTCDTRIALDLDAEVTVDLGAMWDDAPAPGCLDLGTSGPEAFLAFRAEANERYTVMARAAADDVDPALSILTDCGGICEAGSDRDGPEESLSLPVAATTQEVIVMLDSREGSPPGEVAISLFRSAPPRRVDNGGGCACASAPAPGHRRDGSVVLLLLGGLLAAIRRGQRSLH